MTFKHKATILLSKASHEQLSQLASKRGQTLDEFVRDVCTGPGPTGSHASGSRRANHRVVESEDDPPKRPN